MIAKGAKEIQLSAPFAIYLGDLQRFSLPYGQLLLGLNFGFSNKEHYSQYI
jgi:hypothetical protein